MFIFLGKNQIDLFSAHSSIIFSFYSSVSVLFLILVNNDTNAFVSCVLYFFIFASQTSRDAMYCCYFVK